MLVRGGPSYQCQERFLGIIGENPSVSKLNRLHVVIVRSIFMISVNIL